MRAFALAIVAVVAAPGSGLAAQAARGDSVLTINQYLDWEQVADPQLSPDGSQIVYTRRWVNRIDDRWDSALWIMRADGSRNRFLTKGSAARWSPDGTRILYVADGEPKGSQIFVRWMDAEGATSQITQLTEAPGNARWSPDGRSISFTALVRKSDPWKVDMPAAPEGARWTEAPRVVRRMHYRQDRQGFMQDGWVHLFVVPADGGTARQLTGGDWHVGARFDGLGGAAGYDWTPDGRALVFDGYRESDADRNYRNAHVHVVEVASGTIRQLTTRPGTWTDPAVSPDGRLVAFVGQDSSRMSYRADDLYVMALDGSGVRRISGDLDRDPGNLVWASDNSGVYFTAGDRGTSNVHFAAAAGNGARRVSEGAHMLSLTSLDRQLNAVGVRTAPDQPGDVVRYSVRRFAGATALTAVNADALAGRTLGAVEEIWYTSSGGTRVQGWLVKPPGFDPAKRYPLILEIHGGPHAMYNVGFNWTFQYFAARGNLVLYTNPRGSTGYGTAFGNAIERAYPSVDYDDLMAGVDATIAQGSVDTTRMYVGGCSGGGVLSSWVIGHTDRFAAAAVRCPVTNWISMAGTTDVPYFTYNFFDAPFWEKPDQWLRQSSLMYVGNVTTPTLVMTGELDLRTPMPQTEEYFSALKYRGIETVLLRFQGEYHGTSSKPSNFMRTALYMLDWYGKHTRGPTAQAASGTGR
jgi:dipeptidyl aminopeptidase/acylaminoacyl peptidase